MGKLQSLGACVAVDFDHNTPVLFSIFSVNIHSFLHHEKNGAIVLNLRESLTVDLGDAFHLITLPKNHSGSKLPVVGKRLLALNN